MKRLLCLLSLCLCLQLSAQVPVCNDYPFWTVTVGYARSDIQQAFLFEVGKTGNETPWSLYAGSIIYFADESTKTPEEQANAYYNSSLGAFYLKGGYRLFRIDYAFSMSLMAAAGYDFKDAPYAATSIRLLFPSQRWALSIEPGYTPTSIHKVFAQINLHIALE